MTTKILDSKGRLSLGAEYASQTVIVDDSNADRIVITPAVVIPANELWVFQNEAARESLAAGLRDARAGRLSDGPEIDDEWLSDNED
ncbi:hypothetical protein NG895_13640 [Aeoliella sp. ICT_H6.2]|uniref:Uncharacterized protein n=1 Tax=Aeoliella straminimaris TaxID=2954799 RepID=A0A9X2FBA1_9BACT|nr:hypothetical protein [Aeoliella straminimaris]MCO6044947.1 hypothetical protein [Aeoliella straminimaris]